MELHLLREMEPPRQGLRVLNKAKIISLIGLFTSLPNRKFARTMTAARFSKLGCHCRARVTDINIFSETEST